MFTWKIKSNAFNTARIECLELQNLFETAEATAIVAEARKESRSAHAERTSLSVTTTNGCTFALLPRRP